MALQIAKDDKLPKDAVKLSEERAYRYQIGIIRNWEPLKEVFAFRAGPGILSATSGISSILLLHHFRKKLKLGVYGRVTSYMPVVVMPAALAALFHVMTIQRDLVLRKYDCPLCLQTRSVVLQTAIGFVYPLFLAPTASFMYATRHFTYRMPYITEQPKEWLKLWIRLTRSSKSLSVYIVLANIITAASVTAMEFSEYDNLQMKMEEHEKRVDNGEFDLK